MFSFALCRAAITGAIYSHGAAIRPCSMKRPAVIRIINTHTFESLYVLTLGQLSKSYRINVSKRCHCFFYASSNHKSAVSHKTAFVERKTNEVT